MEGIPGLILCSGVVVATGRETFRPASYKIQRTLAPSAVLRANRLSLRRLKAFNCKFIKEVGYIIVKYIISMSFLSVGLCGSVAMGLL